MKKLFILIFSLVFNYINAQPVPGDVFREYMWYNIGGDGGGSLRVGGTLDYGGGFIFHGTNIDLVDAVRAEIIVEKLESHPGTYGLSIDWNEHGWILIPEAENIPYQQKLYYHLTYPVVSIPLSYLNQGTNNKFRMRVVNVVNHWDQNLIYGVHIRVYYDPYLKAHPTGVITSPTTGAKLADLAQLKIDATPNGSDILSVQYIGKYEDVNYEGDGIYHQWHYHYHKGAFMHNLGSTSSTPYNVNWSTAWVPDQENPFEIAARIVDQTGMIFITDPVTNLQLDRPDKSVILIKPYEVPVEWVTRSSRRQEKIYIRNDLDRLTSAQMVWTSWGPGHAEGIFLNDNLVFYKEGKAHRYYLLRVDLTDNLNTLKEEENIIMTEATPSGHHGMEVQWPGIMLLLNADFSNLSKTAPSAPDSLNAEVIETGLKINWNDNADNERGFIIERKIDGGSYSIIGKTNWAQRTLFIDTTNDSANYYTYKISSFNDYGTSSSKELTIAAPTQNTFLDFMEQAQYLPNINWKEFAGFYFLKEYTGIGGESGVLKTVPNRPNTSSYIGDSFSFLKDSSISQSIYFKGTSVSIKGIEAFKYGLIAVAGDELDLGSSDSSFIAFTLKLSENDNAWRLYCYNSKSTSDYEIIDSTLNTAAAQEIWYKLSITWKKLENDSISYQTRLDDYGEKGFSSINPNVLNLSGKLYNKSISADDSIFAAVESNDKAGIDAVDNFFVFAQSESLTDVDENMLNSILPDQLMLSQNYPNPFNPSTTIRYSLPTAGNIKLEIFNILGQKVKTLINEFQSGGSHHLEWTAGSMSTGIYFYSLSFNGSRPLVKKMLLIK